MPKIFVIDTKKKLKASEFIIQHTKGKTTTLEIDDVKGLLFLVKTGKIINDINY